MRRVEEMAAGWSNEDTRALVSVWSQTNVQAELDGVKRNRTIFERISRELSELGVTKYLAAMQN